MAKWKTPAMLALAAGTVLGLASGPAIAQDKGSIISFNGPAGEAYIGRFIKGIKETAALKGSTSRSSRTSSTRPNRTSRCSKCSRPVNCRMSSSGGHRMQRPGSARFAHSQEQACQC